MTGAAAPDEDHRIEAATSDRTGWVEASVSVEGGYSPTTVFTTDRGGTGMLTPEPPTIITAAAGIDFVQVALRHVTT